MKPNPARGERGQGIGEHSHDIVASRHRDRGHIARHDVAGLDISRDAFNQLATGAKTLQFQLARAMARKKPLSLTPIDDMANTWQTAMSHLQSQLLAS